MITVTEALLIIVVILLLIIVFKPETVVKFARSLGELRREMKKGEKEAEKEDQ